jgi:hypothetical protein
VFLVVALILAILTAAKVPSPWIDEQRRFGRSKGRSPRHRSPARYATRSVVAFFNAVGYLERLRCADVLVP